MERLRGHDNGTVIAMKAAPVLVDSEFGTGKIRELETLRKLYPILGKPFNYEELGRTCSRTELMHLRRQARVEVAQLKETFR